MWPVEHLCHNDQSIFNLMFSIESSRILPRGLLNSMGVQKFRDDPFQRGDQSSEFWKNELSVVLELTWIKIK